MVAPFKPASAQGYPGNALARASSGAILSPFQVLGPNGEPARLRPEQWTQELLGAYEGYNAIAYQYAPFNPDAFINSKGFKELDELVNRAPIRAALNTIRYAALFKGIEIQPAVMDQKSPDYDAAKEQADALTYSLNNIVDEAGNVQDFRHVIFEMLYAVHVGFSVTEIIWRVLDEGPHAGLRGFSEFAPKTAKQIGFTLDTQTLGVRAITSYAPLTGYQFGIPVEKCLRYTFSPKDHLPYGQGVGRAVYPHGWSLTFIMQFLNLAIESYGVPFIVAEAPALSLEITRAALAQIRQGAPAAVPTGSNPKLMQLGGSTIADIVRALEWHAQQGMLGYLHSTLTAGEGKRSGSLALGQVHENTTEYSLAFVRDDVEGVVNEQLIRRWSQQNYGPNALHLRPRVSLGRWDSSDALALAQAFDYLLKDNVVAPNEKWIREHFGFPPADPETEAQLDEARKRAAEPPPAPNPAAFGATALNEARLRYERAA